MSVNELEPKYEVCRIKPAVLLINESVAMEKRERDVVLQHFCSASLGEIPMGGP